jgi:short-subunit dehydrogenase
VVGFSEAVAEEVRPYGVRVQLVLPDAVDTPIWQQNGPIRPERALDAGRVADLILYLIALPPDAVISGSVIAPFRTRRRRLADSPPKGAQAVRAADSPVR